MSDDLRERAEADRNVLQRLAAKIPGFSGYMEAEERRDVDAKQRNYCAKKLSEQKSTVKEVLNDLISGGDIDGITPFEKLLNRIDKVSAKIKNADRGYSGLFATVKIGQATLDKLYEHDLGLTEAVDEVEHNVKAMDADNKDDLMKKVKETTKLLDRVEEYFTQREDILRKGG